MDTKTPPSPADQEDDALFEQALRETDQELAARRAPADQETLKNLQDISLMPDFMDNIQQSIGGGMAKAVFETKDFLLGEPAEADKSEVRQGIEAADRALDAQSAGYGITSGVSQFVTGLIGAGKLMAPLKATQKFQQAGKAGSAAFEVARGAAAGAVVIDPHEERLSNLIETFPALQNPVTDYLAADLMDSTAAGRFKNALEGIGLDLAVIGLLGSAVRTVRYFREGDAEKAARELVKLEHTQAANRDAFGIDFTDLPEEAAPALPLHVQAQAVQVEKSNREAFGLDFGPQASGERPSSTLETAAGTRTEAPTPGGPIAQADPTTPLSAAPGVKAGEGEAISSALPANPEPTPRAAASKPHIEVTPESVATILKATDQDLQAIAKYGSREAAAEAGQVLSRDVRLPWQKLRGTAEVRTFVDNAASVLKTQMDAAKSGDILSDARVTTMVQHRADLFGEAPDVVIGQLSEAGANAKSMVADMEAGYLIANRMFQETYDVAFKVRNGMLDEWGGNAEAALQELRGRLTASADLMSAAKSISANSGRALRRLRGSSRFTPEDLAKVQTLDGQQLADLIYSTKGDPKKLAQVANPGFLKRVMDEATFSLTNSLLWLYPTHVMNLTSSLYMLAGRPTEKLLGSFAIGPKSGGDILRQQALKEYAYTVSALSDGWTAMVDAFTRGNSILSPHNTEFFKGGAISTTQKPLPWKPVNSVTDIAQNAWMAANYRTIVGLPTRALGAVDEFFKTLRYRAYVQAEAATRANAAGLTGEDFTRFISREMEKAIDPITGQALNRKALQEAQVTTFQQELLQGTAGATIQQVRSRHPVLTFVVPFVKTPINVLRYGWKMAPGLNLLQKDFREAIQGLQGAEAQAHAAGQMALGSMFMGLAATMALNGKITGAGPTDPNLRRELTATGWQPYSYVSEGEDGKKRYIPLGRLDPAGMSLSMVANLVDIMRHNPEGGDAEIGIGALALALAKNFSDRTFLQNIHQVLEALSDPGARGEKYLGNVAGNAIPLSSALRGVNPDPYLREAQTFIDTMMKNLPGYSETLPRTRDAFGEPVWRQIGLSTTSEADAVEAEHTRIILETGSGIGKPDPKFEGVDLRDITLKNGQQAYDRLQELSGQLPRGPSLKAHLTKLIQSDTYQDMPDGDSGVSGTRLNAMAKIVQKYREAAKKFLIMENRETLGPLIKARQREARGAFTESRKARTGQSAPGAQELLKSLGY